MGKKSQYGLAIQSIPRLDHINDAIHTDVFILVQAETEFARKGRKKSHIKLLELCFFINLQTNTIQGFNILENLEIARA